MIMFYLLQQNINVKMHIMQMLKQFPFQFGDVRTTDLIFLTST